MAEREDSASRPRAAQLLTQEADQASLVEAHLCPRRPGRRKPPGQPFYLEGVGGATITSWLPLGLCLDESEVGWVVVFALGVLLQQGYLSLKTAWGVCVCDLVGACAGWWVCGCILICLCWWWAEGVVSSCGIQCAYVCCGRHCLCLSVCVSVLCWVEV